MAEKTTMEEWTKEDGVKEVKLGDRGNYVPFIRNLLAEAGINMSNYPPGDDEYLYDETLEKAVTEFQQAHADVCSVAKFGIFDETTLNKMQSVASENQSDIENDSGDDTEYSQDDGTSLDPHFDSYFSINNTKTMRTNNNDIIITLGNDTYTKKLHNVFMRSMAIEHDTSGAPAAEIYEFIARDLTESDEDKDYGKYGV